MAGTGDAGSWAKDCGAGGCNGDNAMHDKFFLFSRTAAGSGVVATGSANLSEGSLGGTGGWNSFDTDYGTSSGLYARYSMYFGDLAEVADGGAPDGDYYDTNPPVVTGATKSYFYPRAEGTGMDPVHNTLREVDCGARQTTIRVGAWSISRPGVAELLRTRAAEGCTVDVVADRISADACTALTKPGAGRVRIHGFPDPENSGIHQKNLLIEGHYVHDGAKAVFTGSHNLNYLSRNHNDENVLRILNDTPIYDAFVANFTQVTAAATVEATSSEQCRKIAPPQALSDENPE